MAGSSASQLHRELNGGSPQRKRGRFFTPGNTFWFKPGESGNPGGRSKLVAQVERLALSYAPEAVEELRRLALKAKSERVRAFAAVALLDRGMGRPAVRIIDESE